MERIARLETYFVARLPLLAMAGLLFVLFAGASLAQGDNVVARASLYKPLQFGFPYSIRLYDDTRVGRIAVEALTKELEGKGVFIDPEGAFQIDLSVERVSAAFDQAGGDLGYVGTGERGLELTMNIWSSRQDSLLGGRQQKGRTTSEPLIHLNAIVRDNESNEVIWQGDALAPIRRADEEDAALEAAEAMAQVFGKSATYPEE